MFKTIDDHDFEGFMELYDDTYTPLVVNRAIASNNVEAVRYLVETIDVPASTIIMSANTRPEIREIITRKFEEALK